MATTETRHIHSGPTRQRIGLVLGLFLFALILLLPPPEGLSGAGWRAAAVAVLMAVWWITEAIPVYATGLLPLALFPVLDVVDITTAAAPYANPLIFLFMGGFMIALAMQRWGLHTRIALSLLTLTGTRARNLVGGFMLATALLSMWVSNTATTMMMLPIAISVLALLKADSGSESGAAQTLPGFNTALVLAIAYGANIGGLGTLIGTPPNALLAAYFDQTYGFTIGFAEWMVVGLPLSFVLLVLAWLMLTRVLHPMPNTHIEGAGEIIARERAQLGPVSHGERVVAVAFASAAFLWVFRPVLSDLMPWLKLSDAGIAMLVALALFLTPSREKPGDGVLNWEWASRLPWGVLLLFGGGLSLAGAAGASGLSTWIGTGMAAWGGLPTVLLLLAVVTVVVFLTEVTSNTATTATLLPLLAAAAVAIGENPLLLCIPAALAASCAFMLPPATPPNAIVFGSGQVTIPQMARVGVWLNFVSIVVLVAGSYLLAAQVFEIVPGEVPAWVLD